MYVGWLTPEENGLACKCRCLGCGEWLQAVNADKPAQHFKNPKARQKHFRHATDTADSAAAAVCARRAALAAALQLYIERQEIDLPPPRQTAALVGLRNTRFTGIAQGSGQHVRIAERRWVDQTHAYLVLDDGRRIEVVVRADNRIGTPTQHEGQPATGVDGSNITHRLVITVNHPDAASWPPEKLMERIVLADSATAWEVHPELQALQDQALLDAMEQAQAAHEWPVEGLNMPEFLKSASGQESLPHILVKHILSKASHLEVPRWMGSAMVVRPDGTVHKRDVTLAGGRLRISDVNLEQRSTLEDTGEWKTPDLLLLVEPVRGPGRALMGSDISGADPNWWVDGVPDLEHDEDQAVGGAVGGAFAGQLGAFQLLIEVAVTNKVKAKKLAWIQKRDLACLEIDITNIGMLGRVHERALQQQILESVQGKIWLHSPRGRALVVARRALLEQQVIQEERRAAIAEQRAAEREARIAAKLEALSLAEVAGILFPPGGATERETLLAAPDMPSREALEEKLKPVVGPVFKVGLLERKDGLLAALHWIRSVHLRSLQEPAPEPRRNTGVVRAFNWAWSWEVHERSHLPLLHMAFKVYPSAPVREDAERIAADRENIKQSIEAGEWKYASTTRFEALIVLMFPEMQASLKSTYGTEKHIAGIRAKKREAEAERASLQARDEGGTDDSTGDEARRRRQQASQQAAEMMLKQLAVEEERRQRQLGRQRAAKLYAAGRDWAPGYSWPSDLAACLDQANLPAKTPLERAHITEVISSAWAAHSEGKAFAEWIVDWLEHYEERSKTHQAVGVRKWLEEAGLIQSGRPQ